MLRSLKLMPWATAFALATACCAVRAADAPPSCDPSSLAYNGDAFARARQALAKADAGSPPQAVVDAALDMLAQMRYANAASDKATLRALDAWAAMAPDAALAQRLYRQYRSHQKEGRCLSAAALLQGALAIAERADGPGAPLTLTAATDVLRLPASGAAPRLSLDVCLQLLAAWEAQGVPLGTDAGHAWGQLAQLMYEHRRYAEAEQLQLRRLAMAPAVAPGPVKVELAAIYYAQGRYSEAEAIVEATPRPPSPYVRASPLRDALTAKVRAGDLQGALAEAENAMTTRYTHLLSVRAAHEQSTGAAASPAPGSNIIAAVKPPVPPSRRDVLRALEPVAELNMWMGELYHALGQLPQAEARYVRARAEFLEVYGKPAGQTLAIDSDLAILYRMRGDYDRALALREQVIAEQLKGGNASDPPVQESMLERERILQGQREAPERAATRTTPPPASKKPAS